MLKSRMQHHNVDKFKDVCRILFSQKFEMRRLQEIVWAQHPNISFDLVSIIGNRALHCASNSFGYSNLLKT
jgi:hypothetical protein